MKFKTLMLLVPVAITLAGCSSKPDVKDIEPQVKAAWNECKGVRIIDITKTNLIPNGAGYKMPVSFKIELLEQAGGCPPGEMLNALYTVAMRNGKNFNKGEVIPVELTFDMVESEKGWISQ